MDGLLALARSRAPLLAPTTTLRPIDGLRRSRFVDADLTAADFTGASAEKCNVASAILDDVRWEPGHAPLLLDIEHDRGAA